MPEENKGTNFVNSFFHNIFHKYDDEDDEAEYDEFDDDEYEEAPPVKVKVSAAEEEGKKVSSESAKSAGTPAPNQEKTGTRAEVKKTVSESGDSAKAPSPKQEKTEPPSHQSADVSKPSAAAGKLGSLFGKFVEIITQPDDSEFFETDEDMDEILSSAGEGEDDKKRSAAASSLYVEKPERKSEPEKAVTEKPVTLKTADTAEPAAENKPAESKAEEKTAQPVKKAEITMDEIMQVRQTDVRNTPLTFRMPSPEEKPDEPAAATVADSAAETAEEETKLPEKTVKVKPVPISGKKEQKAPVKVQKVAVKPASAEPAAKTEEKPAEEQTHTELFSAKTEEKPAEEQTHTELFSAKTEEKPAEEQTHTELFSAKAEEKPAEEQTHTELFSAKAEEKPAEEQTHTEPAVSEKPAPAVPSVNTPPVTPPAAVPTVPAAVVPVSPAPVKPAPVPAAVKPAPVPVPVARPAAQKKPVPQRTVQSVYDEIKTARRAPEPTVKPDLSEPETEPIVYHISDAPPFIVMAGKFSKTIRVQYEISRKYGTQSAMPRPAVPKAAKPAPSPAPVPEPAAAEGVKEEPAAEAVPAPKIKKKPPIKMPKRKKTIGESISGLFSGEDKFEEDPDAEEAPRPELEDYRSSDEADEIKSDINENLRNVFVRTVVLTSTAAAAIITALLAYFLPWLFTSAIHHGWLVYALVNLLLLGISVYVDRYPIYSGLMSLLHFRGDSDTAGAVAVVAVTIQTIFALFLPDVFVNGTYHIYVPLVIFALLLGSLGKLLIIKRTADNFRFLLKSDSVWAGKIYKDLDKAEELVKDLPSRKPIIAYIKKSAFMSNFLHLSYAADPVEELCRMIAPFTSYFSLLCGVGYTAVTRDVVGGVSCFALSAVILIPMCGLLALNIPMKNLSGSVLKKGAMLAGYESVKQFADTNTVMLDYSQLYPKGSIILSGIKAFNENKIQEAILAGAAVTFSVGGSLSYIFETMIQDRRNMLPKVDSVSYDDNMGLLGWVEGRKRVLIGNRALLEYYNITPPDEKIEAKYRKMGNEIAYITFGGELVAMFILTYKADRKIAEALREMEENGVSFLVRTIDPNITSKHIADKFSLYGRCVKVLPTGLGAVCYDEISGKEKSSRAYLVTNGSIEAFAAAVTGCIKMKSAVTISKIIQMLSIGIGFVLVNVIAFLSGFAKLGCFELLLYICFWCAALIAVSVIARKIS